MLVCDALVFLLNKIYYFIIIPNKAKNILPVVPAPVYAIKHLLVDNSQSLTIESLPDDNIYYKK